MPDSPQVSVLMPVHNAARWLGAALESLGAQSLADYEVVAIDDASDDGSRAILDAHARRDPRIRVYATEARERGIVGALNVGLRHSRGAYAARMDADDIALPERLAAELGMLEGDPSLAAVACMVEGFPPEALGEGMQRYLEWQNALIDADALRRDRFVESPVVAPSLMMRTEFLRDVLGGWRERGWPEDWDLVLRTIEAGGRIARVPHVLQRWRQHRAQATRVDPRYGTDALLRARSHFLARYLRTAAAGRSVWLLGAGPVGKTLAEALAREGLVVAGFAEVDPNKIGNRVRRAGRRWPVVASSEIVTDRATRYAVAAVGRAGARARIRAWLLERGWVEERDFIAAA